MDYFGEVLNSIKEIDFQVSGSVEYPTAFFDAICKRFVRTCMV